MQKHAVLTVRGLEPALKERLRVRAATHGRSMEAEARAILATALGSRNDPVAAPKVEQRNLAEIVKEFMAPFGGVELDIPRWPPLREPPFFRE